MKTISSRVFSALFLSTALSWSVSAAEQAQDKEVTVGVILATTGAGSAVGVPSRNALDLWPAEIAGRKLHVLPRDDRSDPAAASSLARRLISEDQVDVIVGGSLTPGSVAIAAVANESGVPHLTLSPTALNDQIAKWSFNLPPTTALMASAVFEHMKGADVNSVGYIGFSDVWGDLWLGELRRFAEQENVKVTAEERFGRADTSVFGQALRLISSRPDVILVGGTSSAAGLVQKTLVENGYTGNIYHTHGAVTSDFLRVAGKAAEGAIAPASPSAVAEELPEDNATKGAGTAFVTEYEAKHGPGTRTPFGAHVYDAALVLQAALPEALKQAEPGTPEFRKALKMSLESVSELPVAQGVISYTAEKHDGMDERGRVLVVAKDNKWSYLQ